MDNENVDVPVAKFTREQEMIEYGKLFGVEDLARQFAADPNKNLEALRTAVADRFKPAAEIPQGTNPGAANLDMTEKEVKRFSISRAILAAADGNWKNAEFERECHEEVAKRVGRDPDKGGSILLPGEFSSAQRDLSVVGGGAAGAYLVGTDHMPGSFIEILRNKIKMLQLGVRTMSGLVGNPSIPRQDGAATAYWIAEGVAPTESQQVFAQLGLSPKTVGAKTDFTRQLLIQSAPSVDMIVMDDLSAVMARAIDLAIIAGTGSAGQPTGILGTTGVDEVNIIATNFAYKDAVHFESLIAEENAPEAKAWLCRPGIRGTLKVIPKIGSTYPVFLCGDDNKMNGYPVEVTMQMPADTLLFGDYSQVILGEWGVLELEANRHGTGFAAGNIEVRALHMVDVAVRYPQALKKLTAFVSDQD